MPFLVLQVYFKTLGRNIPQCFYIPKPLTVFFFFLLTGLPQNWCIERQTHTCISISLYITCIGVYIYIPTHQRLICRHILHTYMHVMHSSGHITFLYLMKHLKAVGCERLAELPSKPLPGHITGLCLKSWKNNLREEMPSLISERAELQPDFVKQE